MNKRESFRHLTEHDRDRIHALYGQGHDQKDVARVLGFNKSTVSRELARYDKKTWRYNAAKAQKDADEKRRQSKHAGMKIEANPELKRYIIQQLRSLRSPDEIAGRLKAKGVYPRVGKNAIYKWLYSAHGRAYAKYLCTKRTRRKRQSRALKKVLIPNRISLRERPNEPFLVHSERDLFVSPTNSRSKEAGLLIVVPEVKLFAGSILPNKKSKSVMIAAREQFKRVRVDTTLADNGIENVDHETLPVPSYFCDKASPWQKPHVEGGIGLVRRWFLPKGTDLATIPDDLFQSQLHLLNHKWRRSLGYRSSYEAALERGIIKRVSRISLSKAVAFR